MALNHRPALARSARLTAGMALGLGLALGTPLAIAADLPQGVKNLAPADGPGEALVIQQSSARSAKALVQSALDTLKDYLGGKTHVLTAVGDQQDLKAQASVELPGSGKLALVVAFAGEKGGVVYVLDDKADHLQASLPGLMKLAQADLTQGHAEVVWQRLEVEGQGTLPAPQGWQITGAVNGMIDAAGPEGEAHLGLFCPVMTPEGDANGPGAAYGVHAPLIASYGDPVKTLKDLWPQFSAAGVKAGEPPTSLIRIIDTAPAGPGFPGLAEYVHLEWQKEPAGAAPEKYQTLALINTAAIGGGQFNYYTSFVSDRSETFADHLPTLMRIWGGWKVDPKIFAERMQKAMESLAAANKCMQESAEYRMKTMEKSAADWDEIIRGYRTVENHETGERHEVPLGDSTRVLNRLNEGGQDWKEIPLRDQ